MLNVELSALSARSIDGIGILTGTRYMLCINVSYLGCRGSRPDEWISVAFANPIEGQPPKTKYY
jgi:hypothetical protein